MRIYGYTIVDTLGFNNGEESLTRVFKNEEERNNEAYKAYRVECEYADNEGEIEDDYEILDKKDFTTSFKDGYVLMQRYDSHFQIESWEAEL